MTLRGQVSQTLARDIPVRRIEVLPTGQVDRSFVGGDLLMSHLIAVLSAMFPNGEDFFIRSVRNCRDRVSDPELKRQVNCFIGQESTHGRLHRDFNRRLSELGFKCDLVDRVVHIGFNRIAAKILPDEVQLAVTAALEHYTATFAELLLSDPQAQALFTEDAVRYLLLFHALEESEHKAVAFDVYQAVSGNNPLRRAAMNAVSGVFLGGLLLGTVYSAVSSLSPRDLKAILNGLARLPSSPFFSTRVVRRLRRYNHKDFHPDEYDATEMLNRWRVDLFGPNGVLAARSHR